MYVFKLVLFETSMYSTLSAAVECLQYITLSMNNLITLTLCLAGKFRVTHYTFILISLNVFTCIYISGLGHSFVQTKKN